MKIELNTSIPIQFEVLEEYDDSRFLKGKIWVCHVGQNLNNSIFNKEIIEKAIPSLSNIPVLGYIEANNANETDFTGHEQRIVIDDDGARLEYLGRMYGTVPESNNAQFEFKVGEDGVNREYLTVEVLIHTKFQECVDIVTKNGFKNHSMELHPSSIKGQFNENKLFEFTDFKFEGLCLLGDNVTPAMKGSVLELYSQSKFNYQVNEMIQEFNTTFSALTSSEGGKTVNEKLKLFTKYPTLSEEEVAHLKENLDNYTLESLEEELKSISEEKDSGKKKEEDDDTNTGTTEPESTKNEPEPEVEPEKEPEPEKQPESTTDPVNTDFALASQIKESVYLELGKVNYVDDWGYEENRYMYQDHDENRVYVLDRQSNYVAMGFNYTLNGDILIIDFESGKRVKFVPQDMDENEEVGSGFNSIKETFERMGNRFQDKLTETENKLQDTESKLETKIGEAVAFSEELKNTKEEFAKINKEYALKVQEEQDKQFEEFFSNLKKSKEFSEEEINGFKSQYPETSFEELRKSVIFAIGEKMTANFTATKSSGTEKPPAIDLGNIPNPNKTGKSYEEIINKYKKN